METSLIGKAKELEVASILVRNGLYVFFPLVDSGTDLVVTNNQSHLFIPVRVKYRAKDSSLCLTTKDIKRFEGTNIVLAFVIGTGIFQRNWFVPFSDWHYRSKNPGRNDGKVYVTISEK